MRLVLVLVPVMFGLAGCQTGKPIAMTVTATPTVSGIQGSDVLAPQRAAGQDVPPLRGQEIVTVRTFEHVRKKGSELSSYTEIEDVACTLESEGYRAAIKTPAEVRVPDYGYASRPISVRCSAPGYKTAFGSASAYNKTADDRLSSAGSGGLAGVLVVALINAASDEKKHDFTYRPIRMTMNRIGCEKSKGGCR